MRDLLGLLTRRPFRQSRAAEAEGATHEPEQQSSRARELSGSHATDSARQQEPKPRHDTSVRIRLGAVVFDASLDILTSGSRLFAAMFSGAMRPGAVDDDGALLLDGRDPELFFYVLRHCSWSRCSCSNLKRERARGLFKPEVGTTLGVAFSPEFSHHSILRAVHPGSLAADARLGEGDLVTRLNGEPCFRPMDTARTLREAIGLLVRLCGGSARLRDPPV